jgi:hypothetical protein
LIHAGELGVSSAIDGLYQKTPANKFNFEKEGVVQANGTHRLSLTLSNRGTSTTLSSNTRKA